MHSESSGFARTWPSLPMSPELSGVVRAFRAAPAPGASRPLTSESLTGTTSRAFIPRASCVLASGRLSGVEPGMMSRALTPPHIRKAHALSHPEAHAPVAPSKLMRSPGRASCASHKNSRRLRANPQKHPQPAPPSKHLDSVTDRLDSHRGKSRDDPTQRTNRRRDRHTGNRRIHREGRFALEHNVEAFQR